MWKNLLVVAAAAAALSIAVAGNADAQRMGMGARGGTSFTNVGVNAGRMTTAPTRAGMNARAQVRGPAFRPPGWSHGRKVGWHCRVGTRGCIPPGLR
jgi:hypothetical protein